MSVCQSGTILLDRSRRCCSALCGVGADSHSPSRPRKKGAAKRQAGDESPDEQICQRFRLRAALGPANAGARTLKPEPNAEADQADKATAGPTRSRSRKTGLVARASSGHASSCIETVLLDALQMRINGLTSEFTAATIRISGHGSARPAEGDRRLRARQKDIVDLKKIGDIEEEARRASRQAGDLLGDRTRGSSSSKTKTLCGPCCGMLERAGPHGVRRAISRRRFG